MHSTQEQPPGSQATGASFFASIRRAGIVRTRDRWGGGVAGGLARRVDIDPAIMRGVFVVVTLFTGVGLLVYGLCWALLPEEGDGRIHLEEAMAGRFDAALAAAGAAVIIGLARPGFWFAPFGGSGAWGVFIAIIAIGAVIALIAVAHSRGDRDSAAPPPGAGGWSGPSANPAGHTWTADSGQRAQAAQTWTAPAHEENGASVELAERVEARGTDAEAAQAAAGGRPAAVENTEQAGPGADVPPPLWSGQPHPAGLGAAGAPMNPTMAGPAGTAPAPLAGTAGPAGAAWAQPHHPSRRRQSAPGYRIVLVGLAGVFLVIAAVLLGWFGGYVTMSMPPLVMAGGALVVLGAVIAVAGLMGRRGGWLTFVALAAAFVAALLVAIGFDGYGARTLMWDEPRDVAYATTTYRVTSQEDFDRFEDWHATTPAEPVVLDLTPIAESPEAAGLDLGDVHLNSAENLHIQLPADIPFELRLTGEDARVDAWDVSTVRAEAIRTVENWAPDRWVLGAGGEITFTSAIAGDPLTVHIDAPGASTSIDFVQEQS